MNKEDKTCYDCAFSVLVGGDACMDCDDFSNWQEDIDNYNTEDLTVEDLALSLKYMHNEVTYLKEQNRLLQNILSNIKVLNGKMLFLEDYKRVTKKFIEVH